MYSPKIGEEFIPYLYKKAREEKIPMTKLVNDIIKKSIKKERKNNGFKSGNPDS